MTRNLTFNPVALLLGLSATLVGVEGMAGYALSRAAWLRSTSDTTAIVISAALALAAGGIAVVAAALTPSPASRRVTSAGGAVMAVLGLVGMIERIFGTDLGIDLPSLHGALAVGGATPGRMVPAAGIGFAILGASLFTLRFAYGRRTAIALTVVTVTCVALGATSLAAAVFDVEFLASWPTEIPRSPIGALGLVLLSAGLCSVVLRRAKYAPGVLQLSQSIQLTSVWMLSVIAIVAGVSTFALAQYEYQNVVRADLARTLRERREFLEYAIDEHLQQVILGAHPAFTAPEGLPNRSRDDEAMRNRLQASADRMTKSGFSGWRFELRGATVISGEFIEHPDVAMALSGRYRTELLLKNGSYFLRTRIPVREDDRDVGFAIAEDPFPELTRLKLQADSWGETGSMALCTARDDEMACFPSRYSPVGVRVPRKENGVPLPMSRALDQELGLYQATDYRGHRVLAAYGPVGYTGLGMVIKVDAAEINAPLGRRFGSAVALLALLVVAGVWLLRRRLRPLVNALIDAREEATHVAAQFKAAAESSLDAYFLMDAVRDSRASIVDFRIRYVNASGEVLAAKPSEDMVGKPLREVLPAEHAKFFIQRYRRIVTTGESLSEEFRASAGHASASWIAHQAVKLGDGVSITARDITEIKAVERKLRSKAENDVLTGLPNRALFFDRLGRALAQARQSSSGVGVLFLDVDRFKQVNDTHGHAAGDAVLVEFAQRLRKIVRTTDTVARLGGDEFAIILPNLTGIAKAEDVAADILDAISAVFHAGPVRLAVGTSIGVGFSNGEHDTPEALVGRADRKLYQAKTGGRGRFSSATERCAA
ncbi:MAG TPA: diguanylate cyclase [Casimicrobiaceae bacterium]|nr:diguanylate cyclase [Casimicrobiaceae bacterium]